MKKRNKSKGLEANRIKNPVAKFAFRFNKAQVFNDKSKYQRKVKYKGKEPFPMMFSALLEMASVFMSKPNALQNHHSSEGNVDTLYTKL